MFDVVSLSIYLVTTALKSVYLPKDSPRTDEGALAKFLQLVGQIPDKTPWTP